ncbi:LOW QUALITY PROTEIN: hypothetical protein Cgig2_007146 [Carnegiea gigantea]|uniref:DUF8040 domain-containing protein n=1 Tax=Carnegiea gigantea TaxID=171969 RepID=A0A9Q1KL78_9CARY|nr:LOW QUALITY PROTEIN: hypothetical protein Cgig2_007146 [Carnegiea gigantea]
MKGSISGVPKSKTVIMICERTWEFLISKIGVGVDYKIGAVIMSDSAWQEFLPVPANLEKMKLAFHGSMPLMKLASSLEWLLLLAIKPNSQREKRLICDSDKANEDGSDVDIKCLGAEETLSQPKNEGGASNDGKRQELLDWSSRNEEVHRSLAILHMREESRQHPSLIKQVQARLKEYPQISAMGLDFICRVMDYIKEKREEKFFLDLDDEFVAGYDCTMDEEEGDTINTILIYTLECFHVERPCSTLKERAICGESGANYIHKLLYGNRPYLCRKVFRLGKDAFTHLVSIFMERGLLKEDRFVKLTEIVAINFFILARGASYREAENCFQHYPSIIDKYHKQVLDGLVRLFANIVRPYQSQNEFPTEIVEKKGFYWPFFKVWFLSPRIL